MCCWFGVFSSELFFERQFGLSMWGFSFVCRVYILCGAWCVSRVVCEEVGVVVVVVPVHAYQWRIAQKMTIDLEWVQVRNWPVKLEDAGKDQI